MSWSESMFGQMIEAIVLFMLLVFLPVSAGISLAVAALVRRFFKGRRGRTLAVLVAWTVMLPLSFPLVTAMVAGIRTGSFSLFIGVFQVMFLFLFSFPFFSVLTILIWLLGGLFLASITRNKS